MKKQTSGIALFGKGMLAGTLIGGVVTLVTHRIRTVQNQPVKSRPSAEPRTWYRPGWGKAANVRSEGDGTKTPSVGLLVMCLAASIVAIVADARVKR